MLMSEMKKKVENKTEYFASLFWYQWFKDSKTVLVLFVKLQGVNYFYIFSVRRILFKGGQTKQISN